MSRVVPVRDHVATFLLWLFFLGYALDISSFAVLQLTPSGGYEANLIPAQLWAVWWPLPFVVKVGTAAFALFAASRQTRPWVRHLVLFAAGCAGFVGAITNGIALSISLGRAV